VSLNKRTGALSAPSSPLQGRSTVSALSRPGSAPAPQIANAPPFRPTSMKTKQPTLDGTFSSFPPYIADPYDDKKSNFATMPDRCIPVVALPGNSAHLHKIRSSWRPGRVPGTLPSPSVITMVRTRKGLPLAQAVPKRPNLTRAETR
jgi:hypothetical protein